MKIKHLLFVGTALLLTTPMFATTFYGGVEDWMHLDNDYNDMVFSLKGNSLSLQAGTAQWFGEPALGTSGTPFWNNSSLDGPKYNVGYCIYGGGTCNGGHALMAGAEYLAANSTSKTGSADNVTFTSSGAVTLSVALDITRGENKLGWYSLTNPKMVHWFSTGTSVGSYTFDPDGAFGLVDQNMVPYFKNEDYTFYSQSAFGSLDSVSHFAFFGDPDPSVAPEPGLNGLVGLGLLSGALFFWRRKLTASAVSR